MLSSLLKEAPSQIRVHPCPACNETISADASDCRFCHLPIDASTSERLVTESQRVTTAVAQANTFRLSIGAAVLLIGVALFNLYMDRSLTVSTVICSFIALVYGSQWLYRNSSRVTHDPDYPAAITKVKGTMVVWVALLLIQIAAYVILNGLPDRRRVLAQLPQPLLRKLIHDGDNRPLLNITSVTAQEFGRPPSQTTAFPASTLLRVILRNDGKTSARLTKAVAQTYMPSGDCDVRLLNDGNMNLDREVQPGTEEPFYFAFYIKSPCKMTLVLKINAVYTNLDSGVEYTQELPPAPELSLEYPPVQQQQN